LFQMKQKVPQGGGYKNGFIGGDTRKPRESGVPATSRENCGGGGT